MQWKWLHDGPWKSSAPCFHLPAAVFPTDWPSCESETLIKHVASQVSVHGLFAHKCLLLSCSVARPWPAGRTIMHCTWGVTSQLPWALTVLSWTYTLWAVSWGRWPQRWISVFCSSVSTASSSLQQVNFIPSMLCELIEFRLGSEVFWHVIDQINDSKSRLALKHLTRTQQ